MEKTYCVYRAWNDGEMMEPHLLAGPFSSLADAKTAESNLGGYIKDSDGRILAPDGAWL